MFSRELAASRSELTARDFVDLFEQGWRNPDGADGLLDFFGPFFDPAVHMSAPLTPDCHGVAQVEEFFRLLFDVVEDLHGDVTGSTADDDVAHISIVFRGTVGSRAVEFDVRDRIVVRNGKLVERAAFGTPAALTVAILRTPTVWRKAARLLLRRRWSAPPILPEA